MQSVHAIFTHGTTAIFCYGSEFLAMDNKTNTILAAPAAHPSTSTTAKPLAPTSMPEGLIRTIAFHKSGQWMAVASDSRNVEVWNLKTWELVAKKMLLKRPNALAFADDGDAEQVGDLVVADKFGDVYRIPVTGSDKIKLLLGHCSLVTDMILCHSSNLLLTSDRDEKIRISKFPDTFEIQGFCLGHTGFITKMCLLPSPTSTTPSPRIASGGGDGSIRFWDIEQQAEVQPHLTVSEFAPELNTPTAPPTILTLKSSLLSPTIAVCYESVPIVSILTASTAEGPYKLHKNVVLPRAALDVEFDAVSGELLVAFAPPAEGGDVNAQDKVLVAVCDVVEGTMDVEKGVVGVLNAVGTTSEVKEKVDYGAYIHILRKFTDDEKKNSKRKQKEAADAEKKQLSEAAGGKKKSQRGGKKNKKNAGDDVATAAVADE
ncbi:WD repeat-containing protein 4 [Podochytrium sp. JEL0797]|nr:WD repeat-containing protein 4 [Podochytrium sp. JEL0797]